MKKCPKCKVEISSERSVREQWEEYAENRRFEAWGNSFPFKCNHCKTEIIIEFEIQPYFYLNK